MVDEGSTEAMVCHGCVLSVRWRWIFVALKASHMSLKQRRKTFFFMHKCRRNENSVNVYFPTLFECYHLTSLIKRTALKLNFLNIIVNGFNDLQTSQ